MATTATPRRHQPRPSTSGSSTSADSASDSHSGSPNSTVDQGAFASYSPASDALSLSDEDEFSGLQTEELYEPWDFVPKPGDAVWVKSSGSEREIWFLGLVQKSSRPGTVRGGKQGTFYMVRYRSNIRKYFSPLLGDIKPDTPHVRILLKEAGCEVQA